MKKKRVEDKSIRFLIVSIIGAVILTVGLFTSLSTYMNKKSADTIEEVGKLYMNGMNEQMVLHYETVIGLRLSQIGAIADTVKAEAGDREGEQQELEYSAKARGFSSLAFCSADGEFEMIYGEPIKVVDPDRPRGAEDFRGKGCRRERCCSAEHALYRSNGEWRVVCISGRGFFYGIYDQYSFSGRGNHVGGFLYHPKGWQLCPAQ